MKNECTIVQDLFPLYEEDLLQLETKQFIETHLQSCQKCRSIAQQAQIPLPTKINMDQDSKKMIRKITRKLTTIQIFFIAIAFILAMGTTVLVDTNDFLFILTYSLLGLVTYLFYRSFLVTFLLAGIPNFLWNCLLYMTNWFDDIYVKNFSEAFQLAITSLIIHLIFTLVGSIIGFCILKIREKN